MPLLAAANRDELGRRLDVIAQLLHRKDAARAEFTDALAVRLRFGIRAALDWPQGEVRVGLACQLASTHHRLTGVARHVWHLLTVVREEKDRGARGRVDLPK